MVPYVLSAIIAVTVMHSSSDNSQQVVELAGHPDLQIVVNTSL